jgi:hypothetical protein
MDVAALSESKRRNTIVHDVAIKIRAVLDHARDEYGGEAWDAHGTEADVVRMVTSRGEENDLPEEEMGATRGGSHVRE